MTTAGTRFARGALIPALFLGAAACAPLFDRPKPVEIRPVETPSADGIAPDDNAYRSATKAIEDRDYALALDDLQAARERQPKDVRVLNAFGVVYDKLGRFDLSARYYAQARTIEPRSTIVLANIAYSHALQGLAVHEPATTTVAESTPLRPDSAAPWPAPQPRPAADARSASIMPVAALQPAAQPDARSGDAGPHVLPPAEMPMRDSAQAAVQPALRVSPEYLQFRLSELSTAPSRAAASVLPQAAPVPAVQPDPPPTMHASHPEPPPVRAAGPELPDLRRLAQPETPAPIPASTDMGGLAPAHSVSGKPLLTGHPLSIVNASGRKGATDAMRRRLVHLGWTAPRWATRDGTHAERTTLFYAQPSAAAARALAHTLRFTVQLTNRSCGCGGLELVVGADFLRRSAFADNLESGRDDSGGTAKPAISKEHDHVPAKA